MTLPIAEALRQTLRLEPSGEPSGNVSVGQGMLDGRTVHCALVENRVASGALGVAECTRLGALFDALAARPAPLVLFLDSAGAKVSEGLPALGAFRRLFASGLECALGGSPVAAVLGTHCFGGSSMLAHLAGARLFGPGTRLAMSGPAILAASAGMGATDAAFRAMADATISAPARQRASARNTVAAGADFDLAAWLRAALAPASRSTLAAWLERHRDLGQRLPADARTTPAARGMDRTLLDGLFPGGWNIEEADGVLAGEAGTGPSREAVLGLVRRVPVGAATAWRFAEAAWGLGRNAPPRVRVLLDCATHAGRLEDERIVLSEFIVDMASALAALARQSRLELTVTGEAGGGVYVALAAPAPLVSAVHGAAIRVLPHAAIAAILGDDRDAAPDAAAYAGAGVAERELRLGIPPNPTP
ncbi:MAG TPA: biotin-independent malonate decarboxylase subunit gamma [Usitatibacter sp.]|nr:biotin-independent malonate decarboxylase subunit gamma [Usitatibacter sp.]